MRKADKYEKQKTPRKTAKTINGTERQTDEQHGFQGLD